MGGIQTRWKGALILILSLLDTYRYWTRTQVYGLIRDEMERVIFVKQSCIEPTDTPLSGH